MLLPCSSCGNCCTGEGYTRVNEDDIRRLSTHLSIDKTRFKDKYLEQRGKSYVLLCDPVNGDCTFLKDKKCLVHQVKPELCRTWPFWSSLYEDLQVFEFSRTYCSMLRELYFEEFRRLYETQKEVSKG